MFKKGFLVFLAYVVMTVTVEAQTTPELQLAQADSLYAAGKYIQAFENYYDLFENKKVYSDRLLLRMAQIKEASGDYTSTLYYLSKLFYLTADKRIIKKIIEIAQEQKLSGYTADDTQYAMTLYQQYKWQIVVGIFMLFSVWLGLIYRTASKGKSIIIPLFAFFMFVISSLWIINFHTDYQYGIILTDNALLMNAPAAGAQQIGMGQKGEKVKILSKTDIWLEIVSENKTSGQKNGSTFVRATNVGIVN
jgi:hypothetical protein